MRLSLSVLCGLLFSFLLLTSCQKELSLETLNESIGTLKADLAGNCLPATVIGSYHEDTSLTANNFIDVQVMVTTPGSFDIYTDTLNGFYFKSEGIFDSTGLYTVRLAGNGTPNAGGTFTFHLHYGSNVCDINITVIANLPASYTIDCSTVQVNGDYLATIPMTASNTAIITGVVSATGSYTITTPVVNGVSFSATGNFAATSTTPQQITLIATGTPLTEGVFDFPVTADSSTCTFQVTFQPAPPPAIFTLSGDPGTCFNALVNGNYVVGTALNSSNTVIIKADVTGTGLYTISTNTVNGMTFSASGLFTVTGQQDIVLTGTGTPTFEGVSIFTPQAGASSCTFDITVSIVTVDPGIFTCKIDGIFTAFNDRAQATIETLLTPNTLIFDGFTGPPNGSTVPEMQMYINNLDGSVVTAGTYKTALSVVYRIEIDYAEVDAGGNVIRWNTSSDFLSANPAFTITVSSITSTRVKGTFSGSLTNVFQGSTQLKTITEGTFDLPVQ